MPIRNLGLPNSKIGLKAFVMNRASSRAVRSVLQNSKRKGLFFWMRWTAFAGLFAWAYAARAQSHAIISQPPPVSATPPAMQEYQNSNPMQVFSAPGEVLGAVLAHPFQWGPLTLHPHVSYQFLYGSGVESSPGQQQSSIVQTVAPGILFNLGSHLSLDYTPTLTFYSSSSFRDTVNHSIRLNWGTVYNDWVFGASQSAYLSSQPTVETGVQTDQETYSTALNASYKFNTKLSLDTGVNQDFNYAGNGNTSSATLRGLSDSKTWSTMNWLNYTYAERLNVGIGIGLGYNNVQFGPDSIYEQYQGRINWRATDKISFRVSGGAQDQQYLSGGAGDLLTPIVSGTIQYQPFDQTRLSVTADRTVSPSSFQNQSTENTGVNADLNQRLLGVLYLNLSGGYSHTKYVSSASGGIGSGSSRSDDQYTISARLICPFLKRGTFAVFYQYSDNSSTQTGFGSYYQTSFSSQSAFSYTSSQVGFEIAYSY